MDELLAQCKTTFELPSSFFQQWSLELNRIQENIPTENNGSHYDLLRIYVKRSEDIEPVRDYMNVHYPETLKHYLVADVCRPELLVEIEGIAHI